ncbi:MAG: Tyrosine-protein kinase EpsD [Candidatus Jettenia ecosi]|uniref:Tyrosine-protein kinase EpsD n=1 Tax=Candidatus Jettenia ecosi TaxID=2494326 RepID=A0A533QFG5_9BACT|nr:MAG: Tyrosine-protein kinase EpsD [Candidatus Jettenia ecosi]
MTQNEIVFSNPVIERAVKVLKLHERPSDYELNYCSVFKAWLIHVKDKYLVNLKPNWLTELQQKKLESKHISPEQERAYAFRMNVENLKTTITVEPIKDTNIFTIGATDFDPVAAATIANVVSRSYIIFDLEQQLAQLQLQYEKKHPIIIQLRNEIDKMTRNLAGDTLPDLEAIGPATVKVIEQAQIPLRPIGISKRITMVIALFMGLFVGVMLTFGLEYIDHTLKSPLDVETFLNVPLLGSLPRKGFKDKKLIKDKRRTTPLAQFYHNLSDRVQILMKEKNVRSILITASSPSDGSTTIIANLGNFLSNKAGHKVLIIDANLKTPTMHKIFKISDNPGLIDIMEGRSTFEKAAYPVSHNLTVLPAGKAFNNSNTVVNSEMSEDIVAGYANVLEGKVPLNNKKNKQISPKLTVLPATRSTFNSIATLDSYKMLDIINIVKEQYDIVLVDYANLKNVKDVYVLSSYLDGVALVVSEGKTRRHVIKALLSPLEQKKANFLGVILNNRSFAIPKLLYERL